MRTAALLASAVLGVVTVFGSPRAAAAIQPAERFHAGGAAKISVRHVAKVRSRRSWGVDLYAGGAAVVWRLEGPDLAATWTAKGRKRTVTLNPDALTALAAEIEADVESAIGADATVTIDAQSVTAKPNANRAARRIDATLKLLVAVGDAEPVKGLFTLRANGVPRRVLVLDDAGDPADGSAAQVAAALTDAGHFPVPGGFYQSWIPPGYGLSRVDCVFLLQGVEYSDSMDANADALLAAWVRAGGGLLRTEWGAYEAGDAPSLAIDALLPAISPDSDYDYGAAWTFANRRHPLARGLRKRFAVPTAGWSMLTAIAGAEVVATTGGGYPAITAAAFDAGRVVHVNHDMRYTTPTIQPDVLRVLVNAATYLAP